MVNENFMTGIIETIPPPRKIVTLNPLKDAFIRLFRPRVNYGTKKELVIGKEPLNGDIFRSLIEFDLSSIPKGLEITKAVLKLNLMSEEYDNSSLSFYVAEERWDEQGVTWTNQPKATELICSIIPSGDITIDIFSVVQDWYNGEKENYGIFIKSTNEDLNGVKKYYAKESDKQPILEIEYYDPVVYSYADIKMNSFFNVRNTSIKDLTCSFQIITKTQMNNLSSSFDIRNPSYIFSKIIVVQNNITSTLTVRRIEKNNLISNVIVREESVDELEGKITVSHPIIYSTINVINQFSFPSKITVRNYGEKTLSSYLLVSNPNINSKLFVKNHNNLLSNVKIRNYQVSIINSEFVVSNPNINSRLFVTNYNNLLSSVTVQNHNLSMINSKFIVSRSILPSSFSIKNINELISSFTVSKRILNSLFIVRRTENIDLSSNFTVISTQQVSSKIIVTPSLNIPSYFIVRHTDEFELFSTLQVSVSSTYYAYAFIL